MAAIQFTDDLKRKLFYALSALLLIAMVVMSYDWGPSNDERYQVPYADLSLDYYLSFGSNDTVLKNPPQLDPSMPNYGIVIEMIPHFIHRVTGAELYGTRHAFIAFVSFFYIFFGALIAKRFGGWNAAFLAMAFLVFTPRIFGEAFNNPKDPPYVATTIFALYTFMVFLDSLPKPSWRTTALLAAGVAASVIIRISGLMTDFIFVLFLLWEWYYLYKNKITYSFKDIASKVFVAMGGGYLLGIIFWPSMINSPFSQPFKALEFLRNLPVTVRTLFEGKYLQSSDIPWYYLPKYFIISNPEIILIGILGGFILLYGMLKKYNARRLILLLFSSLFPLFLIIYNKTGLLTGWRHGYFIYIPLVIFSAISYVYFIDNILKNKIAKGVAVAVIVIGLVQPFSFMLRNYPLFYVYFNPSSGGVKNALGNYELDYYSHSMKPATDWILTNVPDWKNKAIVGNNNYQIINIIKSDTPQFIAPYVRYRERYNTNWDYGLFTQSFIDAEYLKKGYFPPKGTVKVIEVDGVPIACIIKRDNKDDYLGKMAMDSQQFDKAVQLLAAAVKYDEKNEIAWTDLGMAQLNSGKAPEAIQSFSKALEIASESMPALNGLGYAYAQTGQIDNAIQVFEYLREQNPQYVQVYQILAQLYNQKGNTQMAQQYMQIYQQYSGR